MRRELAGQLRLDLARKPVVLTGARQVGKTTLARQVIEGHADPQHLNWDVPAELLVFDEIHKMPDPIRACCT
jgi:predicted AAA+ superfamily ATPase